MNPKLSKNTNNFLSAIIKSGSMDNLEKLPEFTKLSKEEKQDVTKILLQTLNKNVSIEKTINATVQNLDTLVKITHEIVPQLIDINQFDLAIIIASFSSMLEAILEDKANIEAITAGMHKLMCITCSEDNERAKLTTDFYNAIK